MSSAKKKGGSKKKDEGPFAALRSLKEKLAADESRARAEEDAKKKKPAPRPAPRAKPATARATGDADAPSDDDALAFHRLVSGVTPLDRSRTRIPRSLHAVEREGGKRLGEAGAEAVTLADDEVHEHLRALVEGGSRFEVSDDGRRVEGRRVDVPPDWVRKLRRGLLPIDGRLDLHGLDAAAAREAVEQFLRAERARGERCVLVIHGKGDARPGGGVLRGEIAAWLSQGRSSTSVAAFATARDDDGGEGAVYVLLRR